MLTDKAFKLDAHPCEGVTVRKNAKNKFVVFEIHYSADPKKRSDEYRDYIKTRMPRRQYLQEYELVWDSFDGLPVYEDFKESIHCSKHTLHPQVGLPILRAWDWGLCYDSETEVLTESGWKLFRDVEITKDKVATLDPETFEISYHYPEMKVDEEYTGKMVVWDNQSLQACMTPEHIVPVWTDTGQFVRKQAKDLLAGSHARLRMTGTWHGENVTSPLNLTPKIFAAFMGMYLSEGSIHERRITIYQVKDKTWIREILDQTPWTWHEFDEGFRCTDVNLAEYLNLFKTQEYRFVPPEIKWGTPEIILEFVRTYSLGDGHIRIRKNGCEEHTIYTCSKRMADDLSELAMKVNWYSAIIWVAPARSYYAREDRWIQSSGGYSIRFKKTAKWADIRGCKRTLEDYSGRVYCLRVPNHTLYVRKNGRPHWNGNTPACIIGQYQGETLVILEEFQEVNMGADRFTDKVIQSLRQKFPEWNRQYDDFRDYIDPAGFARKDTDMKTCAGILQDKGCKPYPGPINFEIRRQAVEYFLIRQLKSGPCLQINADKCPILIRGFKGGYRYPDSQVDKEPKPLKDMHSHLHDSLQYLCSGVRDIIGKRGKELFEIPKPDYGFKNTDRIGRNLQSELDDGFEKLRAIGRARCR